MKAYRSFCLGLGLLLASLTTPASPMFTMSSEVKIGPYEVRGFEAVTIEKSTEALADTATITVPGMAYNTALQVEDKIKRGDKVVIRLGYDGDLKTEFTGYLKSIHPNAPMKLECEDSIYLFRKPIKDKSFKKTTAKAILEYVVAQVNPQLKGDSVTLVTDVSGIQFDSFTIIRATAYEVLDKLKQETGCAIYCRGNDLHFHLAFTEKTGSAVYDFAKNVEVGSELEYVKAADKKVQIKVVGRSKKGATVEVEVGEKGGDSRTFQRPTVSDRATLEQIGKEELKKLSFDGYKGSIRAWLIPVVDTGYSARIIDSDYKEREGSYYVTGVKTEFSRSTGGRRTVSLGIKV